MVEPVVRWVADGAFWEVSVCGRTWRHSQPWQVAVFYEMALAWVTSQQTRTVC